MALLPQNPRDRNLMVIGVMAVALAIAYQQLLWTPKRAELTALATRLDTLDSLNRLAKIEVAKGNATKLKAEADELSREIEVLRGLVPTQNEVPALLEAVSTAARRAGLELSDVQPDGGPITGDQFDAYRFRLAVTGPWHEVAVFLANVGSLPRIVSPINLVLTPSNRNGERKPKKGEQFVEAKFGIQTYVAHAAVKTVPTSAKTGAP